MAEGGVMAASLADVEVSLELTKARLEMPRDPGDPVHQIVAQIRKAARRCNKLAHMPELAQAAKLLGRAADQVRRDRAGAATEIAKAQEIISAAIKCK